MTERLLPPKEWPRLDDTMLRFAWRHMLPTDKVMVVEDSEGRIIGHCALLQVWHLEGVWIDPAYRKKVSVMRHLLRTARKLFAALHITYVSMMTRSPEGAAIAIGMGDAQHLGCDHFVVKVR